MVRKSMNLLRKKVNKLSQISILVTTIVVIVIFSWVKFSQPSVPKLGEFQEIANLPLSNVTFKDSSGKTLKLSDFKGKMVILHSWATWCGPCLEEIPELLEFYEEFKEKNIQIIALAREPLQQDPTQIKLGKMPVYFDQGNKLVQDMMMIAGIPSTLFINPQGKVEGIILGKVQWKDQKIRKYIKEVMEKK